MARGRRKTRTTRRHEIDRRYTRSNASGAGLSGTDIALILAGVAIVGYLGLWASGAVTPQLV
jgi:hypothetical protein